MNARADLDDVAAQLASRVADVTRDAASAPLTTYRCGGPLAVLVRVTRAEELDAVAEVLVDAGCVPARFKRMGIAGDRYVSEVGSQDYLRAQCGLDAKSIAEELRVLS